MDRENRYSKGITEIKDLRQFMHMTEEEINELEEVAYRFPMAVTPYYLSLIDFSDPEDPIRKMSIPSSMEKEADGEFDTSGEGDNTKFTGVQHKYAQTALVLSTNNCAMYCRHCFRKRMVGMTDEETMKNFTPILNYIKEHEEITNVLISGGDSFLLGNSVIRRYLEEFSKIKHLNYIRFGTRTPVTFPELIYDDDSLLDIFKAYGDKKSIYVSTQFNHPRELTHEAKKAVTALLDAGVIVSNQTVLLKGVNDDPKVLAELFTGLTKMRIVPYYLFQCRPVAHVKTHFQVPLLTAADIVDEARSLCDGYAKRFRFAMSHERGKIEILGRRDNDRMLFKFHQAKDKNDAGKIFELPISKTESWLEGFEF